MHPMSGMYHHRNFPGYPVREMGGMPGDQGGTEPFYLTYKNANTDEFDMIYIDRAAIRSGSGLQPGHQITPVQTNRNWMP